MIRLLIITLILLSTSFSSGQSVERIEPPFWWTGMKDSSLQIMLYNSQVSDYEPVITNSDVKLTGTTRVDNPNYLYLDLIVRSGCRPGKIPIKLTHEKQPTIAILYELRERAPGSASRKGFDNSDAIYLITPDRFVNGDVNNDNLPDNQDKTDRSEILGRHGGDIEGVRKKLDYISSLGFTAIWLNPILENKMPRHSYHGYAITDFYKVDPRFGTNESYRNLCIEASNKNIRIIKDMVVNHCGLSHWWMNDLPSNDWINYHDKPYTQTNHRKTINSDPYAAAEDERVLSDGWFVRTMPDLNLRNPLLAKYMTQNSIWWIEYAGLSGIRMDTYPYPDEDYMSEWSRRIMQEYPRFNIAGEIWHDDPAIVSYWQKGKQNNNGYTSWLPALFDFPLQTALSKSLMTNSGWEDSWMALYEMLAKDFHYADPNQMVVFADNHDMSRIYTQLDQDFEKYKMALTYILTVRGIPQIYYGTEILMSNKDTDNHGVIRSDYPGGWSKDPVDAFTGEGLSDLQNDARSFMNKLLNWRKSAEVVHVGKTKHFVPENNIYVFFRYTDEERLMVVLNKNDKPATLDLSRFRSILGNHSQGVDVITGKQINISHVIELESAGPLIIEIN